VQSAVVNYLLYERSKSLVLLADTGEPQIWSMFTLIAAEKYKTFAFVVLSLRHCINHVIDEVVKIDSKSSWVRIL